MIEMNNNEADIESSDEVGGLALCILACGSFCALAFYGTFLGGAMLVSATVLN